MCSSLPILLEFRDDIRMPLNHLKVKTVEVTNWIRPQGKLDCRNLLSTALCISPFRRSILGQDGADPIMIVIIVMQSGPRRLHTQLPAAVVEIVNKLALCCMPG